MATPTKDIFRGSLKNFPQSIWGYSFASLSPDDSEMTVLGKEVEGLKEQVNEMLTRSEINLTDNIQFIELLFRLGVSYHFEDEIDEQLHHIFTILPKYLEDNDYDLYTLAILFRILRQNGFKMTCDVFKKFKDTNGEFKKTITNDVKGLLALYEACFLATNGEDILDEALSFTKKHLKTISENSNPNFQKYIKHALVFPCHRTMERLDTFHYISFYEQNESRNETLLKFAKLDYNMLQLRYRQELAILSRWWEDSNIVEKLPFARDRLVEAFIWGLASVYEPQYSLSRMLVCKYVQLETLIDDIYDSYGTLDELHPLTDALQRFTSCADKDLPEYMKVLYKFICYCFEETEKVSSYKTSYAREMLKELARSYIIEANWQNKRIAPGWNEYMKHGKVTSTYDFLTSGFILGSPSMGMKEIVWVRDDPPIVSGSKLFGRLMNDISAQKDESKRDDFPKGMDAYMKEYGVSYDEAIEGIQKVLEKEWKNMNEDLMNTPNIPKILLKYTFNYARMSLVFYEGTDLYTYAPHMKQLIASMFINPFPV